MRRVTLSFDNGPWPGITDHVLAVLEEHSVRATFFVIGERLRDPQSRQLAQAAHAQGHWIGNHTMSHGAPLGTRRDAAAVKQEIADMDDLVGGLAHPERYFRPNGLGKIGTHLLSAAAVDYLAATSSTIILWTSVPKDRDVPADAWVEEAKRAVEHTDWSLLVLHDRPSGHNLPAGSMSHLNKFLTWASESGIEIVQEFPESCVPMRCGRILRPLDGLTTPQ